MHGLRMHLVLGLWTPKYHMIQWSPVDSVPQTKQSLNNLTKANSGEAGLLFWGSVITS